MQVYHFLAGFVTLVTFSERNECIIHMTAAKLPGMIGLKIVEKTHASVKDAFPSVIAH